MPPTKATSPSGVVATDDNDLLVVAATTPDPMIEQHLSALFVDDPREGQVLALAEVHELRMRAPEESPYVHAATGQLGDHVADLGAGPRPVLVGVALPVGEVHPVAGLGVAQSTWCSRREVLDPVDQDGAVVALGPSRAVTVTTIDLGRGIAAFRRGQEPVVEVHAPEASGIRRAPARP